MKFQFDLTLERAGFALHAALQSEGRRIGLFGPSGAGKTTLVRILAGLEHARGELRIDDELWLDSGSSTHLEAFRRNVGWVPQASALLPHLTIADNLKLGVHFVADRYEEVVEVLGLGALLRRLPGALSGGEQKRVALGRALLASPRLLLLDEPLAGLDWPRKRDLLAYLLRALDRYPVPALFVSHDPFEIGVFCDQVWLMEGGQIIGTGDPEQVFLRPESPSHAYLAGIENLWRGTVSASAEGRVEVAIGSNRLVAEFADSEPGAPVVVVLAAAEVLLMRASPTQTSARNIWRGRITEVSRRGREVAVHLACRGPGLEAAHHAEATPLVALITPAALSELELSKGDEVFALFKAPAARVFAA